MTSKNTIQPLTAEVTTKHSPTAALSLLPMRFATLLPPPAAMAEALTTIVLITHPTPSHPPTPRRLRRMSTRAMPALDLARRSHMAVHPNPLPLTEAGRGISPTFPNLVIIKVGGQVVVRNMVEDLNMKHPPLNMDLGMGGNLNMKLRLRNMDLGMVENPSMKLRLRNMDLDMVGNPSMKLRLLNMDLSMVGNPSMRLRLLIMDLGMEGNLSMKLRLRNMDLGMGERPSMKLRLRNMGLDMVERRSMKLRLRNMDLGMGGGLNMKLRLRNTDLVMVEEGLNMRSLSMEGRKEKDMVDLLMVGLVMKERVMMKMKAMAGRNMVTMILMMMMRSVARSITTTTSAGTMMRTDMIYCQF